MRRVHIVGACVSLALSVSWAAAAEKDIRLLEAIKSGRRDAVRALLQQRVDVNLAEADGTTALHWAVRADDLDTVRLLIRAGANPKAANRYGLMPLSLAALNGSAPMLEALLKAGADPNTVSGEGETALMTAARSGNVEAVKVLAGHGANVNAREQWLGETALMWAAAENHAAVTKTLIELGADINIRSMVLDTPKLQFPKSGGPNIPFPSGGWTASMHAAREGAIDAARVLADAGADLNVQDPDGTTALVFAIINVHFDHAAMLLEKGADPNVADSTGMAALYAAVHMNTLQWVQGRPAPLITDTLDASDLVKVLLDHNADPNARLKSAILKRHHYAPDGSLGAGTTPLMRAVKTGDAPVARLLLERGADPFIRQRNRTTPLMLAAGVGNSGFLSGDGPRIRIPTEAGAIECVQLLLDRGVDINAFNDTGATALHGAVGRGTEEIVKFLAAHGAKLDIRNKAGRTPLDLAIAGRRVPGEDVVIVEQEMIALLRQLLAGTTAQNAPSSR